jgi:peptidoglycan/xylan/chitin deacetylase (PgdA/CDA1 family)
MRQRELILNFHGIGEPHHDVGPDERPVWISRDAFVTWLDTVCELRDAQPIPIHITFDDGNASDLTIALPELLKRNLTATFFLCAGRLQKTNYIDHAAALALLAAGMQIGSHGMHHRDWQTLDEIELAEEIGTARKMLADACDREIVEAAVPFGSYNQRVLKRLRAEGFNRVYTSDHGLAEERAWLKPRITLRANSGNDLVRFLGPRARAEAIVRDIYRVYKSLR